MPKQEKDPLDNINWSRVGKKLKEIRLERGYSIKEAALKIDVDESYIIYIEAGKRSVSCNKLIHICNIFDVSLDQIFCDEYSSNLEQLRNSIVGLEIGKELNKCNVILRRKIRDIIRVLNKHTSIENTANTTELLDEKSQIELNWKNIGRNLRMARERKGYTAKYLEIKSGVHYTTISDIENARKNKNPGLQVIVKLCNALEVSLDQVVSDIYTPRAKRSIIESEIDKELGKCNTEMLHKILNIIKILNG